MQNRQVTYWFELGFWLLMVRLLSRARLLAFSPRLANLAQEIESLRTAQPRRQGSFARDLVTALGGWLGGLLVGMLIASWML
jgi:hypothetical protein